MFNLCIIVCTSEFCRSHKSLNTVSLLYNPELCANVVKQAKLDVKNKYNWTKIAQDTHFTYQKAICQTMAERQARQIAQEEAKKTIQAKNTEGEITNLLGFKKRQAYA